MTLLRRLEVPVTILLLLSGAAFLLKMCYMSLAFNCAFTVTFLSIIYLYLRLRHGVSIPLILLALVFLAMQVDTLGNFFRMSGHQFGPMQYDEFAHMTVQVLVTPIFIWFVQQLIAKSGNKLSPTITAFFAATTIFSMSAFYEIIQLWDEMYAGGHRIWGVYDTANEFSIRSLPLLMFPNAAQNQSAVID